MGFSIWIDWGEEFKNPDKWINHGRDVLVSSCNCEGGAKEKDWCEDCDISEDNCNPMMNFIYPLELKDFDEDKILKVVKNTNCSVMENQETGEWFLVLCGGGMDLSQDIALSYIFLEKWIPEDLITQVCKQRGFSISKDNFEILKKEIIEQSKHYNNKFNQLEKDWEAI